MVDIENNVIWSVEPGDDNPWDNDDDEYRIIWETYTGDLDAGELLLMELEVPADGGWQVDEPAERALAAGKLVGRWTVIEYRQCDVDDDEDDFEDEVHVSATGGDVFENGGSR